MNYKVEIKRGHPFHYNEIWSQALDREDTAIVTFFNSNNEINKVVEYGYLDTEELYKCIRAGEEININNTYINGFSYTDCCGIDPHDSVDQNEFYKIKNLSASNSFFDGDTLFEHARFLGNVYFPDAIFVGENISFDDAIFENTDIISFSGATFGGFLSFSYITLYKEELCFHSSRFYNEASFSCIKCEEGEVDFAGSIIYLEVAFYNITFGIGKLSFYFSDASKVKFKDCTFNGNENLRFKKCNCLEINDCVISNTIEIRNTTRYSVEIKELHLIDTKNLGFIYLDWDRNNVKGMISHQGNHTPKDKTTWSQKADQYVLLKENYKNIGQYDDEDKAFVEFKRCQRKALRKNEYNSKGKKRLKALIDWFFSGLIDAIGVYGTRPRRVTIIMALVIVLFTGVYYVIPDLLSYDSLSLSPLWTAFQHSLVTFLTIGYGNTVPARGLGVLLCGIEGFTGVFLMAYFVVAIVRKTLR